MFKLNIFKIYILLLFIINIKCYDFPFKDTDGNYVTSENEYFIMDSPTSNCLGSTLYNTGRYIKLRNCDKEDYDQRWNIKKSGDGVFIKNFRGCVIAASLNIGGYSYISETQCENLTYGKQNNDGYIQFYTFFGGTIGTDSEYFLVGKNANCGAGCIESNKDLAFIFKKL